MQKHIFIYLTVWLLASCATSIESQKEAFNQAVPSNTSLAQAKATSLVLKEKIVGDISADDPLYQFEIGKSHFDLYELPTMTEDYLINVQTLGTDFDWGPNGKWFYSIVGLLDGNYNFMGVLANNNPTLRPRKDWSSFGMDAAKHILEANYAIKVADVKPKYLVLFTSPVMFDFGVAMNTPSSGYTYMVGNQVTYVPSDGSTTTSVHPFSPYGEYELTIIPKSSSELLESLTKRYQSNSAIVCINIEACSEKK